jgi:hypothetical protein
MEVERAWGKEPGWFLAQSPTVRVRLLAWAKLRWEPPPETGSTKQGKDFWTS